MLAPTTPIQLNRRGTCTIVISWFYRNSNTASAWIEASQCFIRNLEKIRIDERRVGKVGYLPIWKSDWRYIYSTNYYYYSSDINNNIDINSVAYINRGYYCTLSSMFGILRIKFFIRRSHTFFIKLAAEGSKTLIIRRSFIILLDKLLSRFYELSEEKLNLQCRCRYGANRKPS